MPFLHFDGNCREAMEFYKECFGAELFLMPYSAAPSDQTWVTPESRDRIMHSTLRQGDLELLMAADICPARPSTKAISRCHRMRDLEEIDALFKALSVGGEVAMPLQDMFWNARFGMINDKFGIHWMLNYALPKQA